MHKLRIYTILLMVLPLATVSGEPEHGWNSPATVVEKIVKNFGDVETYAARFKITTTDQKKTKTMSGYCKYKKGGKMRFDFANPSGDVIVSNGKKLWIYLKNLNAVGVQSLDLKKKRDNRPVFTSYNGPGLKRLFSKYHYKFDKIQQPRVIDGGKYFVLDLEQRTKIGGFPQITLHVDAKSYFIRKAVATNDFGLTSVVEFYDIKTDIDIQDGEFRYNIPGNARIVQNPLVNE